MATVACFGRERKAKYADVIFDLLLGVRRPCHLTNPRMPCVYIFSLVRDHFFLPTSASYSSQRMNSPEGP